LFLVEGVERVEKQSTSRRGDLIFDRVWEKTEFTGSTADNDSQCSDERAAMNTHGKIEIIHADRFEEGVIITFSDGQSVLYHPQFLYDMREHNDNRTVLEDKELDEESWD
jgi:hypothetical protein